MASVLSHPAIALGLYPFVRRFRLAGPTLLVGVACSDAPDLDGIGYRLGIPYGSPLGHRGLSHSLLAAALLAFLLARFAAGSTARRPWLVAALYLFLCTASHGLLDALTDGGLGVAFLAPIDNHRFFFPWRPILVSPLGVSRFFSDRGAAILASELVWVWVPSLTLALIGFLMTRRRAEG
jgi:inner membrane protein